MSISNHSFSNFLKLALLLALSCPTFSQLVSTKTITCYGHYKNGKTDTNDSVEFFKSQSQYNDVKNWDPNGKFNFMKSTPDFETFKKVTKTTTIVSVVKKGKNCRAVLKVSKGGLFCYPVLNNKVVFSPDVKDFTVQVDFGETGGCKKSSSVLQKSIWDSWFFADIINSDLKNRVSCCFDSNKRLMV